MIIIIKFILIIKIKVYSLMLKNDLFIGDWGLGIGDWGLGDWPNPPSPIPNPHPPSPFYPIKNKSYTISF